MSSVVPLIEGETRDGRSVCGNVPLTNLEPLTDGSLVPGNPDRYYGARPEQLDQRVKAELSRLIVPSTQHDLPIIPNFFLAAKGPDESAAVAERQACYDGALGARAICSLLQYSDAEPVPDDKAYTITCTYYAGTFKMYTSHRLPPDCTGGPYEYVMTQINSYSLTGDVETFRQGAAAYRNARDWAKWQRDEAINKANEKVKRDDRKGSKTGSHSDSDSSADEVSLVAPSADRPQVSRTRQADDPRPARSSLDNSDTSADELALDMSLVRRPPKVKRFRRAGDMRPKRPLDDSDSSADELALDMSLKACGSGNGQKPRDAPSSLSHHPRRKCVSYLTVVTSPPKPVAPKEFVPDPINLHHLLLTSIFLTTSIATTSREQERLISAQRVGLTASDRQGPGKHWAAFALGPAFSSDHWNVFAALARTPALLRITTNRVGTELRT
ncbi:hypothetical protein F5Y18DRAFT_442176 [Xylariaceae sp. FL1019]|nr:hypothetical protein F5Y18DRAFT_442176 [Xylariaceae sp. FL1019]